MGWPFHIPAASLTQNNRGTFSTWASLNYKTIVVWHRTSIDRQGPGPGSFWYYWRTVSNPMTITRSVINCVLCLWHNLRKQNDKFFFLPRVSLLNVNWLTCNETAELEFVIIRFFMAHKLNPTHLTSPIKRSDPIIKKRLKEHRCWVEVAQFPETMICVQKGIDVFFRIEPSTLNKVCE